VAPETLAEMVRRHRGDLDWTQDQLATQSGVGLSTIKAIETGKNRHPQAKTLLALATALDAQPEVLLGAANRLGSGQRFVGPDPVVAAIRRLKHFTQAEKEIILVPYRFVVAEHRRRRR
jgi:transcriptional regulator with XRE-family HTH domain